ncbi:MAG: DUF2065 domain-containing protein [Halothiobacillaceae bacterium]|nr:DUF2065 domain-containing protein [Halothiobacillaceae bacterium]
MQMNDLWAAFALVLIIEGLLPFLSPRGYRQAVEQMASQSDTALRIVGLVLMLAGLGALALIRG